jgi:hypothetical protein
MTDAPNARSARAVRTTAPIDLAILKDDLNIPPTDTTNDAWLQRRADGVWARFETFCGRKLCSPPQPFVDDWGEISIAGHHVNLPPVIAQWPRTTQFLRVYPVAAITAVRLSGTDIDATKTLWDIDSGKLFTFEAVATGWGGWAGENLSRRLLGEQARVEYLAGWDTVPPDLYEALLGAMQVLWQGRVAQQQYGGSGYVRQIDVIDVGSVQFASANSFVEGTLKGVGTNDPLLGPWLNNITDYIDWRATLGAECFPTTKEGTAP